MAQQVKDPNETSVPAEEQAAEPSADSAESSEQDSKPSDSEALEPQELQKRFQQLERQLQEEREKLLRCRAEMENLRKRTDRELSSVRQYAVEPFSASLLVVRDNLERSLSGGESQSLESMRTGVELTLKELSDVLARFDVEEVAPKVGEPFNPQWHEALSRSETDERPPNSVMDLVQKGYRLHQRLLRPALVIVSAPPEKASETSDSKKP